MKYYAMQYGNLFYELEKVRGYNYNSFFRGSEITETEFKTLVTKCERLPSVRRKTNKIYTEIDRWRGNGIYKEVLK